MSRGGKRYANNPSSVAERTLLGRTCIGCGIFKQGSEYRLARRAGGQVYHHQQCTECQHISAKVSGKTTNDRSQQRASNARRPWTRYEVSVMTLLNLVGWTDEQMGAYLGRSAVAVTVAKNRYIVNGLPVPH